MGCGASAPVHPVKPPAPAPTPMSHEAQGVTGDIDEEALSGYLGLHTVFYVPPVDSPEGECHSYHTQLPFIVAGFCYELTIF